MDNHEICPLDLKCHDKVFKSFQSFWGVVYVFVVKYKTINLECKEKNHISRSLYPNMNKKM